MPSLPNQENARNECETHSDETASLDLRDETAQSGKEQRMRNAMTSGRKRGGQPGNLNALRHGFYSKQFKADELTFLEANMVEGLENEIAMLRVVTRRLLALAETTDLQEMISVVGILGMTASKLAGLLRTQAKLGGEDMQITDAISQALDEILREWKR